MRIQGSNGAATIGVASAARRPAGSAFALPEEGTTRPPTSPSPMRNVGGIEALIALQGVEEPGERRRQAVRRGRVALDALDELKLALLGGNLTPAILQKLKGAAGHLKDISGDPGLDRVLAEIELRVEVEIAKMAMS